MEKHHIKANEIFFDNTICVLREGGTYGWPATGHMFVKDKGKLLGSPEALAAVRKIVSEDFFKNKFGILRKVL